MNPETIETAAAEFSRSSPENFVPENKALLPHVSGMRIYDPPIFGYADAENEYLNTLRLYPEAGISPVPPKTWLESARTVISFFLPFTEVVRTGNRGGDYPSVEWLHGRIEGQIFCIALCVYLSDMIKNAGFDAVIPSMDPNVFTKSVSPETGEHVYNCRWSERHVAFACGLGTFSLSKGLITRKGVAGRFGSLVTSVELPATAPVYSELYEYCKKCGACARNCPAGAIDPETGKDDTACSRFLDNVRAARKPYYGCGKCQTSVPCEARIPAANFGAKIL